MKIIIFPSNPDFTNVNTVVILYVLFLKSSLVHFFFLFFLNYFIRYILQFISPFALFSREYKRERSRQFVRNVTTLKIRQSTSSLHINLEHKCNTTFRYTESEDNILCLVFTIEHIRC